MSTRLLCSPSGPTVSQTLAMSCLPYTPTLTGAHDSTSGIRSCPQTLHHIVLAILLSLMYVYYNKWSYVPVRGSIREIIMYACCGFSGSVLLGRHSQVAQW